VDILSVQGRYGEAWDLAQQGIAMARQLGNRTLMAWHTYGLGDLALAQNRIEEAAEWFERSLALLQGSEPLALPLEFYLLARSRIALKTGKLAEARRIIEENFSLFERSVVAWAHSEALEILAKTTYLLQGDSAAAREYLVQSIERVRGWGYASGAACLNRLVTAAWLLAQTGSPEEALELLALVLGHPVTWHRVREEAAELFARVAAELAPAVVAAAEQRGAEMTLDEALARFAS
jgi:tetratricopeptide (TPR) repeat protein